MVDEFTKSAPSVFWPIRSHHQGLFSSVKILFSKDFFITLQKIRKNILGLNWEPNKIEKKKLKQNAINGNRIVIKRYRIFIFIFKSVFFTLLITKKKKLTTRLISNFFLSVFRQFKLLKSTIINLYMYNHHTTWKIPHGFNIVDEWLFILFPSDNYAICMICFW